MGTKEEGRKNNRWWQYIKFGIPSKTNRSEQKKHFSDDIQKFDLIAGKQYRWYNYYCGKWIKPRIYQAWYKSNDTASVDHIGMLTTHAKYYVLCSNSTLKCFHIKSCFTDAATFIKANTSKHRTVSELFTIRMANTKSERYINYENYTKVKRSTHMRKKEGSKEEQKPHRTQSINKTSFAVVLR